MNGQAWNRYSYVANNPLTFTAPSGYCFLGCGTWQNLGKMQPGTLLRSHPLIGSVVEIAAAGICTMMSAGGCVPSVVAVLATTVVAGITSGRLGKEVLRADLVTTATTAAFAVAGGITSTMPGAIPGADGSDGTFVPFSEGHLANIVGHALVGCGQSAASGGKCGAGALAGALTSAAGPYLSGLNFQAGLVANAALGGAAAVLGGGKICQWRDHRRVRVYVQCAGQKCRIAERGNGRGTVAAEFGSAVCVLPPVRCYGRSSDG